MRKSFSFFAQYLFFSEMQHKNYDLERNDCGDNADEGSTNWAHL